MIKLSPEEILKRSGRSLIPPTLFPDGKKKIITNIFQLCDFMYRRGTIK